MKGVSSETPFFGITRIFVTGIGFSYNGYVKRVWQIVAAVLLVWVLIMFISPVLPVPVTALRAKQLAALFFLYLTSLNVVLAYLLHSNSSDFQRILWVRTDHPVALGTASTFSLLRC